MKCWRAKGGAVDLRSARHYIDLLLTWNGERRNGRNLAACRRVREVPTKCPILGECAA